MPPTALPDSQIDPRDTGIAASLESFAVIEASGADTVEFLHGQFTCDVKALARGRATWGGYCSPRGRLLATFLLVRLAERHLMVMPRPIAAAIAKRLTMFVLRSRVKIRVLEGETGVFGLSGAGTSGALRERLGAAPNAAFDAVESAAGIVVRLGPEGPDASRCRHFFIRSGAEVSIPSAWNWLAAVNEAAWHWLDVDAGIPWVVPATQEQFLPQMLNLDGIGGVSFSKGCYPGQEVVARTQFRGQVKRRMFLAHAPVDAPPLPGDAVYADGAGDNTGGQVVSAVPAPGGGVDLLVVLTAAATQAPVRLGSAQGPLISLRALPYDNGAAS